MNGKQNNRNSKNNKNFFENNPILVFIIFSLVSIIAFKSFFPQDDMNVNGGQVPYGKSSYK